MHLRPILTGLLLVVAACAKEPLLDAKMPAPESATEVEKQPVAREAEVPKGAVGRAFLDHVLEEGPGWLLEKVPVDEVVVAGKFVGWKVLELPAEWSGGELRPGDVVTRLNGMTLETPNEFWSAWTTLGVASELKLEYRRGEEARALSMPIVGKSVATGGPRPAVIKDATERPPRDKRFETVTIEGDQRSASPPVDWTTGN